jgi:uncharacterized membrane protein
MLFSIGSSRRHGHDQEDPAMDKPMDRYGHALPVPEVRHVGALQAFEWLRLGWEDFTANPGPSLAHGLLLVALGWVILFLSSTHIDLVAAAVTGFLLIGPVFGAAFYALSRLRAAGQPATFDASLDGAVRNGKLLVHLGLVLAVVVIAWAWLSGLLFERAMRGALPSIYDTSWQSILDWDYAGFLVTYMTTGAVFALVAFALSAVSAPMIFDRGMDTRTAILTSLKAVAANPVPMAVWAVLIAVLTAIGFVTLLLGLVIVLPLLGHATWHAYRDLVA